MGEKKAGASNFPVITEDAFTSSLPEISVRPDARSNDCKGRRRILMRYRLTPDVIAPCSTSPADSL